MAKIQPGTRWNTYVKFTFRAVYVTEDGRRIEHNSDHKLKRDAVAELASLPKAPSWETAVILENGRLQATTMKIGLASAFAARD